MTRHRLPLVLALVLFAFVALLWVVPALAGPSVDCGQLDQATCDEVLPRVIAEAASHYAPPVPMPVTSVSLSGPADCLSYHVFWLFGNGMGVNRSC